MKYDPSPHSLPHTQKQKQKKKGKWLHFHQFIDNNDDDINKRLIFLAKKKSIVRANYQISKTPYDVTMN